MHEARENGRCLVTVMLSEVTNILHSGRRLKPTHVRSKPLRIQRITNSEQKMEDSPFM